MQDLLEHFDEIKFAALSKSIHINHLVKNVTIGPNRSLAEDEEQTCTVIDEKTVQNRSQKVILRRPKLTNNTNLIINQLQSELGRQRQDKVKQAVNKRIDHFNQFSEKQELEMKQQMLMQQQLLFNQVQQQELMIANAVEQYDKDVSAQHQQLLQYYREIAERTMKNNLELEEKERRKRQINLLFDRLKADQIDFRNIYQDINSTLKTCKYMDQLKTSLGDVIIYLKTIPESMEQIVNQCKSGTISENDCQKSNKLVQELKELFELIKQKIVEVNIEEEEKEKRTQALTTVTLASSEAVETTSRYIDTSAPSSAIQSSDIFKFVSKSSFKIYSELQTFMQAIDASLFELLNNDSLKQIKFECKKAVNIPVNAISAASIQHLADKYNRLSNLLNGKTVEVGGTYVNATKLPQGILYCKNLLAQNFVLQGDLMISSNPEAAFSYSAVIVALWNEHADFGKLLLVHFHSLCPYLVPIYPPRTVEQTDDEFYRSLGYRYVEGVVELQDKFLKRMMGTMRLYAAIIITQPKRGQKKNPHGLSEGWRWLSAFVNLEPKPDISATLLHVFLETAGSTLETVYGKSFRKLIIFILQTYLPILQKIDAGGPVTRLEVLLENYRKQGHFEKPTGMLGSDFW